MKKSTSIGFGLGVAVLLVAGVASAQEEADSADWRGRAPKGAVEIVTGGGLSVPVGTISKGGDSMKDLGDPGQSLQLGVGYRLNPNLMIGGYGEGAMYGSNTVADDSEGRNWGLATGAMAQWHFLPFDRFDPWIGTGMGYRGYWMVDDEEGTSSLHGIDIVRFQTGVDIHITEGLLISPMVGATFTTFLAQEGKDESQVYEIEEPRPVSFLSFGLGGRFDIGGTAVTESERQVASR